MQFLMLIHVDPALMQTLPQAEFDRLMRRCFEHADALQRQGVLLASQQLEDAQTARALRVRGGQTRVTDGPFAETKELLAGFNLSEAPDMAPGARHEPGARTGGRRARRAGAGARLTAASPQGLLKCEDVRHRRP